MTAQNIARVRTHAVPVQAMARNPQSSGLVQRAIAAVQAAPPYIEHLEDWANGAHLEVLREWRGEDAQEWLEVHLAKMDESEGTSGNEEVFDAFIARNFAIVELTSATGIVTTGRGISAGSGSGIHGERAAFRDAVQQLGGNFDWTGATAANLWATLNVRVSAIYSDRELCKTGHDPCSHWAGRVCGGNNITTPVYYGVGYTDAGKRELVAAVKSQLVHYLDGDAQKFYAKVMSQFKKWGWMSQFV